MALTFSLVLSQSVLTRDRICTFAACWVLFCLCCVRVARRIDFHYGNLSGMTLPLTTSLAGHPMAYLLALSRSHLAFSTLYSSHSLELVPIDAKVFPCEFLSICHDQFNVLVFGKAHNDLSWLLTLIHITPLWSVF